MNWWGRLLLLSGLTLLAGQTRDALANGVRCPATIQAPSAGFELMGTPPESPRPLQGLRLFDGPPGEESLPAPAELAPDSGSERSGTLRSAWMLPRQSPVLLVCAYAGTPAYYRIVLPAGLQRCDLERTAARTVAGCG